MISIMLAEMIDQLIVPCDVMVAETLAKVEQLKPKAEVVILDLNLPDSEGLATARAFSELYPRQPKLVCSGTLDSTLVTEVQRAGFVYVNKASSYPELVRALESLFVQAGILQPQPSALERSTNEFHSNIYAPGSDKPLTWKQVEIMRKTAEGLSAKEVARDMNISPDTVRGHIKEIFSRLGAKNKGQAVEIFIRAERKAKLLEQ